MSLALNSLCSAAEEILVKRFEAVLPLQQAEE